MDAAKSWDFALSFSEKCTSKETKGYIIDCMKRNNLEIHEEEFEGQTLLSVSASFEVLAHKVSCGSVMGCL